MFWSLYNEETDLEGLFVPFLETYKHVEELPWLLFVKPRCQYGSAYGANEERLDGEDQHGHKVWAWKLDSILILYELPFHCLWETCLLPVSPHFPWPSQPLSPPSHTLGGLWSELITTEVGEEGDSVTLHQGPIKTFKKGPRYWEVNAAPIPNVKFKFASGTHTQP